MSSVPTLAAQRLAVLHIAKAQTWRENLFAVRSPFQDNELIRTVAWEPEDKPKVNIMHISLRGAMWPPPDGSRWAHNITRIATLTGLLRLMDIGNWAGGNPRKERWLPGGI
ncbi:uncharacterized protein PHACADRAFT_201159 [Phanerochaete carnosa HHB-10118-sp]|uniref:Uncharacterized protein n=1 Tax=Phanerochaete carnosa (strain HHB-10118-sp) TaxID=650164 RepID=K5VUT9_PHACS|nr:uncharacterized protein PHACADRAFT_201159 [Phanerochaete carnosa HHB-10118-sp]EKM50319.1 hypothetical protein PHACADRAFT_201159 [Phanerochaete carnosa HHB-10118-sp]